MPEADLDSDRDTSGVQHESVQQPEEEQEPDPNLRRFWHLVAKPFSKANGTH